MNPWLRSCAPIVLVLMLAPPASAAKKEDPLDRMTPVSAEETIPVIDFFRPRIFSNPSLNPAGTHFAAIIANADSDRLSMVAFDLEKKTMERMHGIGGSDIDDYDWLDDRRLLFRIIEEKRYSMGLFAAEVGRFSDSYVLQQYNVVLPVGFPKAHPEQVILWIRNSAAEQGGDGGVVKINTARSFNTRSESIFANGMDDGLRADVIARYPAPPDGVVRRYIADREGELAFVITAENGANTLFRYAGTNWVRCPVNLDHIHILTAGDEPDELLVMGPRVEGTPSAVHRLNAVTGELGEALFRDDNYDLVSPRFYRHPVSNRVLGIQYTGQTPRSVWLEERYTRIQAAMERAFPGEIVHILGSDREEKQFFMSVASDVKPTTYFHVKLETKSFVPISNVAPWIDPKRMRPMQVVNYKTRDGRQIEGYLTLPAGASKTNPAPLVMLVHGGPWVRDSWGWDAEVQFLASRGYAVFQPNYRGSTGYGWRFPESDDWEFRKMHDDVTDGVKRLLKSGLIDPDRVAIMGGSFGGYLAISGVVDEPDLYRCAVTIAGVFDWERVLKDSRNNEYRRGSYGVFRRHLGDPAKEQEKFDALSPIKRVAQIKAPVFIAHGTHDAVAYAAQSKQLINALKKHRRPYEAQVVRGEGHGFRHLDNQVELYTAIEAFLAKHLAPRPRPVARN